jgi:hypothetical protein
MLAARRDYLSSEVDLLASWEVLCEPPKQPKPPTVKAYLSDVRLYESLQKLTAKKKGQGANKDHERPVDLRIGSLLSQIRRAAGPRYGLAPRSAGRKSGINFMGCPDCGVSEKGRSPKERTSLHSKPVIVLYALRCGR